MNRETLSGAIVFLLLFSSGAMAGPPMKEGKWEITTTTEMKMPGMPFQMPPHTVTRTQCLSQETRVPETQQSPEEKCKTIERNVKGNTVTWVMECKGPEGTTRGEGKVVYKGDTFDGVFKMKMEGKEMEGAETVHRMRGRWVGPCE